MGNKLCFAAPHDEYDHTDHGYTCQKLSMESRMNSTDFECDPKYQSFRKAIGNMCKRKKLPPLDYIQKYDIFVWSSNKLGFGHESIVIGCNNNGNKTDDNENNYGYITAELCVDIDEQKVFPHTQYYNKYNPKWKYKYSYTTTINALIQLILDLISNHGKYSNIHNGCQHFVEAFLSKILISEHQFRIHKILQNDTLFQKSKNEYIRGFIRYKAHNLVAKQMKNERLNFHYDTVESKLQLAAIPMVLPLIIMAISKETVNNQRDRVMFKCV